MRPLPRWCRAGEKMLWSTTSAAGLLLRQDLLLCTASHTHKGPCVPWMLLGWCSTSEAASRAWPGTQGQAEGGWGKPNTGPVREMGHACVFRGAPQSSVQEQSQSWGCRGKGTPFHTLNHLLLFPIWLQKQQSSYCTNHGTSVVPSLRDSPCTVPVGSPRTSCFAAACGHRGSGSKVSKSSSSEKNLLAQQKYSKPCWEPVLFLRLAEITAKCSRKAVLEGVCSGGGERWSWQTPPFQSATGCSHLLSFTTKRGQAAVEEDLSKNWNSKMSLNFCFKKLH